MKLKAIKLAGLLAAGALAMTAWADPLESGFTNPPVQTKPWCYWYWLSDNISKEGITRDLEAMSRVGIGEAFIGNIFLPDIAPGKVKVLTEDWWTMMEHAVREGGRTGVNIGMFNSPGWSQSGGPWIKPEQAMRYLVSSEAHVTGPTNLTLKLVQPNEQFQDVAVLAFPAPAADADSIAARSPRVTCSPPVANAEKLVDGDLETAAIFPAKAGRGKSAFTIEIQTAQPFTARGLALYPATTAFSAEVELQAADTAGNFQNVRQFKFDRSKIIVNVGPMQRGPVTIAFPATTSQRFRLRFTEIAGGKGAALAEIDLSGAARLEAFVEKQLGKMHPTPHPMWDAYLWPAPVEPESARLTIPVGGVRNLSAQLSADGTLHWDVPPGDWIILRTGMTPTGAKNAPASPEGQGLEVDKMNRADVQYHFDAFVDQLLKRMPVADRGAFKQCVADSYEMGSENWTDGFGEIFRQRYGYDPKPWLPVLTGRIVGSADQSGRFLWDLRRLVADRIATEYVGGLRAASQAQGLGLWLENYGHWGFPSEFLKYGGQSDRIGGEFWATGDLGSIECRCASSCANTYGQPIVSAEAFTGGPAFQSAPEDLKARGDWAFCEGINHFVLHVYIHQPWEDKFPGMNAWFGTEFNRHNTWFEQSRSWIDYLRRSCWLLQQGNHVADVAYFIGEDAPKMTGVQNPPLPTGYDFDYINAEVIEKNLSVKDGLLTLPNGLSYRVLVLPEQTTMRPELLRKIRDLVKAGATVIGPPPVHSASLENFPKCDAEVRRLAAEVWGEPTASAATGPVERRFGQGRVICHQDLASVFDQAGVAPDLEFLNPSADAKLLFTHRRSSAADIYFISNQTKQPSQANCVFRVVGRQPELWNAVTGEHRALTDWSVRNGRTVVPLKFAPLQSWFVVFRETASAPVQGVENFPEPQSFSQLTGPWEVSFAPGWGAPEKITFAELTDWTKRTEPDIQHFSGRATYRKNFEMPALQLPSHSVILDLGAVRDLATVRVNGQELATLWTAPWRVDITSAVKPGENQLEIEVVNVWNNRLIGDAALPPDQQRTWTATQKRFNRKAPLREAGLLGPVALLTEKK